MKKKRQTLESIALVAMGALFFVYDIESRPYMAVGGLTIVAIIFIVVGLIPEKDDEKRM